MPTTPPKRAILVCLSVGVLAACSRTPLDAFVGVAGPQPSAERCNHLDDDLDGLVDEDFRDARGAYTADAHCGACDRPCRAGAHTEVTACVTPEAGTPRCVASRCAPGFVPDALGLCVSVTGWLCRPCLDNAACGGFEGARCAEVAGEPRCTVGCEEGRGPCPPGYACGDDALCRPANGSCVCSPGAYFTQFCELDTPLGPCRARTDCVDGVQAPCAGEPETCDGEDNDCDGIVDDPFVNEQGTYGVDAQHCGACGIDCREPRLTDAELTCGGPVIDPHCVMACPDAVDGVQIGDAVDADQGLGTGCECVVRALTDGPGLADTPGTPGADSSDENCDGADGVISESFYVSPDGDDSGPGSPAHPKATLTAALDAANASLATRAPRPHIFVAAGAYEEVVVLRDGLQIHGGYSPDFLNTDPDAYVTEVRTPLWSAAPGGAALWADGVGATRPTSVEGIRFVGASGTMAGEAAFGAWLLNPGPALRIEACEIRAGDGVDGTDGADGPAGASPPPTAGAGDPPRAAVEDGSHACRDAAQNRVAGGAGTEFRCGETDVGGGDGGVASCPVDIGNGQPAGESGAGTGGGRGGRGGQDLRGPRFANEGCPTDVCCGLADFLVSDGWETAGDGEPGNPGENGEAGAGCMATLGTLTPGAWMPATGAPGTSGRPGAGGGGGGAGGGARIEFTPPECSHPDGLGGGGGGGGAAGCAGSGGRSGLAGSPSIGLVVIYSGDGGRAGPPTLRDLIITAGRGGLGGAGGAGGDGGTGGDGGRRGGLAPEQRTIPPLAGATPGGQGGHGGPGGSGGGGGGGCGGGSIGLWLAGNRDPGAAARLRGENEFQLSIAGRGGPGGAGTVHGGAGAAGEVLDVLER